MTDGSSLLDRYSSRLAAAAVSLAAGVAGVLGSYGATGFRRDFVVAPVDRRLASDAPGALITFMIENLGDLGQRLQFLTAGAIVVTLYAVLVGLATVAGRRLEDGLVPVLAAPALVWLATFLITGRPVASVGAALGAGVVVAVTEFFRANKRYVAPDDPNGRRRVLSGLGAAAGVSALGVALGRDGSASESGSPDGTIYGAVETPTFDVDDELAVADERTFAFGEMDPLVSEEFYNVDISNIDPSPDASAWSLSITGAVEEEREYSYADLRAMDFEHRFVTLRCVGERLNSHKMDTALWSGVPVAPLLEEAGPTSDCDCVMLRAADKFYEEFPLEALRPGLIALGMNGEPLPRSHGAPARALVPGHWGEVNVKWLTEIELLERERKGYWEKKGWQGTGPVKTVAKLHARDRTDDGRLVVGGHTYAGTRGIETVEVSVDGGETWNEATLTERLPGAFGPAVDDAPTTANDAWRQWKYAYDSPEEPHEVVCRAIDGEGQLQTREESGPVPSGPTGWVTERIEPESIQ